jgi:hypothetical protein
MTSALATFLGRFLRFLMVVWLRFFVAFAAPSPVWSAAAATALSC